MRAETVSIATVQPLDIIIVHSFIMYAQKQYPNAHASSIVTRANPHNLQSPIPHPTGPSPTSTPAVPVTVASYAAWPC